MNRKKFLKNSFFTLVAAFLFPKMIKGEEKIKDSILDYKPNPSEWKHNEINIAWIGHSTILINFYGIIILTDPILFNKIGVNVLGLTFGPTRLTPPALTIEELPKPDIILLSHAHMDHTDYSTLKKITNKFPNEIDCITAHLTKDVVQDLKWKSLTSIDWNESFQSNGIKFTALEVKHFGWRFPWEKDRSRGYLEDGRSYNAYLIEKNNRKILFGGDTALTDKFRVIKYENIDVAIMPVGAYNPWKKVHCSPEEALQMAEEIGAENFIPIHCKTFKLGQEPFDEPIDLLKETIKKYNMNLAIDSIGQTFTLS